MKGTRLMCGYMLNLFFSALLAMSPGLVLAAETRDGLQEKGVTMDTSRYVTDPLSIENKVHARMLSLSVDNTSMSWYFLFNEYVRAAMRLYDVCETSRPLLHACGQHLLRTDIRRNGAVACPLVCC